MTHNLPTQEPVSTPETPGNATLSPAGRAALFAAAFILVPVVAIILLVGAILLIQLFVTFEGDSAPAYQTVTTTLIVEFALIGLLALLVRGFYRESLLEGLRWSRGYSISRSRLIFMGIGLAVVGIVVSTVFPPLDTPMQDLFNTPQSIVLLAIVSVVAAPFLEEIAFRGFYYRVLEDVAGTGVAVFGTAILFASMHALQLWGSWPAILMILGVGLAFSWLRWHTQSLIPSFLVHTAYNSTLVLTTVIGTLLGVE